MVKGRGKMIYLSKNEAKILLSSLQPVLDQAKRLSMESPITDLVRKLEGV